MTSTPRSSSRPEPAGNRRDHLPEREPRATDRPSAAAVLRCRHVARLLAGTLAGRLPTSMAPLAILLLIQDEGGTLALGGVLCALYGLAPALGQPLLGRLVDRHGQTVITGTAVALTTTALLALAFTRPADHPAAATVLTAATLAHAVSPAAALVTAAIAGLAGATAVLTTAPSRTWQPTVRPTRLLGPLHHQDLRRLFTALSGVGVALGALTVWAVEAASQQHAPWLAGTAPAALSAGSVTAGVLLARRPLPGAPAAQVRFAAVAFAASWLPLLADPAPVAAVVTVLLPGAFLTPLITSAFLTPSIWPRPAWLPRRMRG